MKSDYYFGYGSNLSLEQMKERCKNSELIGKACLYGFQLDFNCYSRSWEGGVADVVSRKDSSVWGLTYKISEADLQSLDRYEGHPNLYRREILEIVTGNETALKAWVYTVVDKKNYIAPTNKYINIIKAAAVRYDFPDDYILFINSFRTAE
ncbi:gamma-glutamylcyclotransferase family protein [Planctomycetota bacterium]